MNTLYLEGVWLSAECRRVQYSIVTEHRGWFVTVDSDSCIVTVSFTTSARLGREPGVDLRHADVDTSNLRCAYWRQEGGGLGGGEEKGSSQGVARLVTKQEGEELA